MRSHLLQKHLYQVIAFLAAILLSSGTLFAQDQAGDPHPHDIVNSTQDSVTAAHPHDEHEQQEAAAVTEPAESASPPTVLDFIFAGKYLTMLALVLIGVVLLLIRRISLWVRIAAMALALVLFGLDLVYSLHPSPMCATTKLFMFRFTQGQFFAGFLAFFLVIFVPMLFGRKLFCGWVCPLGALQELVNKIPFKHKIKKFNFAAFNSVRFALLAMFFITFFVALSNMEYLGEQVGAAGTPIWRGYSALNIYDPINMFELLHWQVDTLFVIMFAVLVIASLLLYRPFCYSICPIGAISWLLEKVSPGKIRIDRTTCNDCGVCVIQSPCPAMEPVLKGDKFWSPDCTSCGECLNTCPKGSIKFSFYKSAS